MKKIMAILAALPFFTSFGFCQVAGEYTPDANTCLLFHLNEASGSIISDASVNGNDGIAVGTTVIDGKFGKARCFYRSNLEYISIPDDASLRITGALTLEAWISPAEVSSAGGYVIVSKWHWAAGSASYYLSYQGTGRIFFDLNVSGTEKQLYSNSTLTSNTGEWHHVAAVFSPSEYMKIFIDGVEDASLTSGIPSVISSSDADVLIGAELGGSFGISTPFNGGIDEVRISNKARDPSEFNTGTPSCTPPTIVLQPASQIVYLGNSVTFSVLAAGTSPLTYQWQKDGVEMGGAVSTSYTIPSASQASMGTYCVVVSNACGYVTSTSAQLTVLPAANIYVYAALHTVGAGTKSGSIKTPLAIEIKVFDKTKVPPPDSKDFGTIWESGPGLVPPIIVISGPEVVKLGNDQANLYSIIVPSYGPPNTSTSGSYLVIGKATLDGTDFYVGSPTDPLQTGSVTQKHLQLVQKGGKVAGNGDGQIEAVSSFIPTDYMLYQNYPDPFNPSTQIQFDIAEYSQVRVAIYDILGREVIILAEGVREAGRYHTMWEGQDANGKSSVSGVYFLRLTAQSMMSDRHIMETKKMMLLR